VQFVDLALPLGVLELPHPLLGHHVDLQRVAWRAAFVEKDAGAPTEHHHREVKRNHSPEDL